MNLDLKLSNEIWEGLVIDTELVQPAPTLQRPLLKNVLRKIGPFPEEALLLGLADDGFPVLLNLWDPAPGPILIAGDSETGKTDLLKMIANFVVSTHQPYEIQYGVMTARPYEWARYADYPHCIGVFSTQETGAMNLIRALAAWIEMHRNSRQSILLFVDELVDLIYWQSGLGRELRRLLLCGPENKIWPVVTVNLENPQAVAPWLGYFHTKIYGYTNYRSTIDNDGSQDAGFETLSNGVEFSLRENSQWIRFRIPR
ncbi:MAG: hypothetical protein IPP66_09145 [Anaerolineales bacterium]|nr:hypothetical protein [Anaerolineales bacterium]